MNTHNEFSVYCFYNGGKYEAVKRFISVEEAIKTVGFYVRNVFVHNEHGVCQRVIITDGGDCICFEWIFGKGITFPTRADLNGNLGNN